MKTLFALIAALATGAVLAAETTTRTHPDPECLKRDADPEKCVIQDGPPPPPRVRNKVDLPPPLPVTNPPAPPQTGQARTR